MTMRFEPMTLSKLSKSLIIKSNLDLIWYCCGFLRAAELFGLSKSCFQKIIVVPFDKVI